MRRALSILPLLALLPAVGVAQSPAGSVRDPETAHQAEVDAWRASRIANLTRGDGWLTLTGLYTLETGSFTLGSSPDADLGLPAAAPDLLGTLDVGDEDIALRFDRSVELTVDGEPASSPASAFDTDGNARLFEIGAVNFFVIQRGDVRLLRVRDRDHPARTAFAGLEYFPVDPAFRYAARFEPYDPVRQIPIANIIGIVSDAPSWGAVVFEHRGETYRIDALAEPGDEELFLIFADATSGKETYGAGRYLYVDAPDEEGRIVLDFNRAYNPPCAFTPFATCPLPPRQNRLDLRIEAGEKNYTDSH